jgi:hypothetical protein
MRTSKIISSLLIALAAAAGGAHAQTFAQFGGASASADGEGAVFMLAGNDAFRAGALARFNISRVSDFGLQIGIDRSCEETFYGGGVDLKIVVLERTPRLPIDVALDASVGDLMNDSAGRFIFDFGILVSGAVPAGKERSIEPYGSLIVRVQEMDQKSGEEALADCLCPDAKDGTDAGAFARVGVKIPVSRDSQILIEADFERTILFGAAFNIIF